MLIEELGLRDPISVGYYDPFSVFPTVKKDLESNCPLTNLHWKYHPLKPVKSIPLLPVKFVEEVPHNSQAGKSAVDSTNVYLRLFFVKADNLETYRSQVRPLIQAWLTDLVNGREVSWAIMLLTSASQKEKGSTLMKKSVYEKLITDFAKGGKHQVLTAEADLSDLPQEEEEFVFRLLSDYKNDKEKLETLNEIIAEFKTLILRSFDRRHSLCCRELEALKESKKSNPEHLIQEISCRIKLVDGLSDMRFFDESLEALNEIDEALKDSTRVIGHAFKKNQKELVSKAEAGTFNPAKTDLSRSLLSQFSNYLKNGVPIDILRTELSMFLGVSILLQSLANSASPLSLSSTYISQLLQKLIIYVNSLTDESCKDNCIIEWAILLVDFYLRLPIIGKLIQSKFESEESRVASLASVHESLGEVMLLKRGLVGKLATAKKLEQPDVGFLLEEIPLDDNNKAEEGGHSILEISNKDIESLLESQQKYEAFYEEITLSAIQEFSKCGRSRTIDLLSVDLAVLNYKRENYKEAYEILSTSYDYFIENGWNYMGGILLEIYINCLDKLDHEDSLHIFDINIKLLTTLKHEAAKASGINKYDIVKSKKQRKRIFEYILDVASRLKEPVSVPLDILFGITLSPHIEPSRDKSGTYSIEVQITNHLGIELEVSELTLEMTELDASNPQIIVFSDQLISLSSSPQQTIKLYTREFKNANFQASQLCYNPRTNVSFVQSFLVNESRDDGLANNTVIHNESETDIVTTPLDSLGISVPVNESSLQQVFYMYDDYSGFTARFQVPKKVELNASEVELGLCSGELGIHDVRVEISPDDVGVEISEGHDSLNFESIKAGEESKKVIPYKYFGDNKTLSFSAEITYFIGEDEYKYYLQNEVNNNLLISITVQDVFRSSSIYSKFQIGCSQARIPIRIVDLDFLCNNDKYDISTSSCDIGEGTGQIVFGEQPAFMFFSITPKSGKVSSSDTLDLTISYSSLRSECENSILALQREIFESFELLHYLTLLSELVEDYEFDLSEYAISNTIIIKNAETIKALFQESIENRVKSEKDRAELVCCANEILGKSITVDEVKLSGHQLYIPVAVPILDILHKVEFTYDKENQHLVGEPIDMKLHIESSTKWSDSNGKSTEILASSSPAKDVDANEQMFQYIVHHEDNWLLSGLKRHDFPISGARSQAEFELTLIPLNVGKLPLPRVSIKPVGDEGSPEITTSTDTVHENGLETVLIVPELQSITFTF